MWILCYLPTGVTHRHYNAPWCHVEAPGLAQDCGSDAHQHVPVCRYNTVRNGHFAREEQYKSMLNVYVSDKLRTYLDGLSPDQKQHALEVSCSTSSPACLSAILTGLCGHRTVKRSSAIENLILGNSASGFSFSLHVMLKMSIIQLCQLLLNPNPTITRHTR